MIQATAAQASLLLQYPDLFGRQAAEWMRKNPGEVWIVVMAENQQLAQSVVDNLTGKKVAVKAVDWRPKRKRAA